MRSNWKNMFSKTKKNNQNNNKTMKKSHLWQVVSILILTLCCLSCNPKENLNVTKTEMNFAPAGGSDILPISADCQWDIDLTDGVDWVTFSQVSGENNGAIIVTVSKNETYDERNATITVVSNSGKIRKQVNVKQEKFDIVNIHEKFWFLYEYERWATDYKDDYIEDSYEHWNYFAEEYYDNWFFYFMADSTGYQIHTKNGDTIYYPCNYIYYPFGDSLYINFLLENTDEVEDYHTIIHQVTEQRLQFSDEFLPHRFENMFWDNVTATRKSFKINPKKVMKKEHGPLIQPES